MPGREKLLSRGLTSAESARLSRKRRRPAACQRSRAGCPARRHGVWGSTDGSGLPPKSAAEARKHKYSVVVAKLDRLNRGTRFISGLMAYRVPLLVAQLGPDVDPFILHLFVALAEKGGAMISTRTKAALAAANAREVIVGGPRLTEARKLAHAANKANADQYSACCR